MTIPRPSSDTQSASLPLSVTVYSPESPLRRPGRLIGEIVGDLWRMRGLIWILFARDMKAQFRQSALGYAWLIIPPLVTATAWYALNRSGLIRLQTGDYPPAAFVLIGTTLWSSFSAVLTVPMDAIDAGKSVFTKLNVPMEAFVFAGVARSIVNLAISSAVLLLVLFALGVRPGLVGLLFAPAALGVLLMGITTGMFLAPMSTLYSDIRRAVSSLTGLLMFTVPVLYQVPEEGAGLSAIVIRNNPFTPAFAFSRDVLLAGSVEWLAATVVWLILCVPIMLISLIMLRVARPHIVTRMGM